MTMQRKIIKEVLLEVDPQTRTFFANVLKQATGLELLRKPMVSVLKRAFIFLHMYGLVAFPGAINE